MVKTLHEVIDGRAFRDVAEPRSDLEERRDLLADWLANERDDVPRRGRRRKPLDQTLRVPYVVWAHGPAARPVTPFRVGQAGGLEIVDLEHRPTLCIA